MGVAWRIADVRDALQRHRPYASGSAHSFDGVGLWFLAPASRELTTWCMIVRACIDDRASALQRS